MSWRLPLLTASAIAGATAVLQALPGWPLLWTLALLLAVAARHRLALACVLVALLAGLHVAVVQPRILADGLAGQDVRLSGRIEQIGAQSGRSRIDFRIDKCRPLQQALPACSLLKHVRLNWYRPPELSRGQRWQLTARLKPPRGYANPDSFDYRQWLIRQGFGATGYVRDDPPAVPAGTVRSPWQEWAQRMLAQRVDSPVTRQWLAALTLGQGDALSRTQWEALAATGTTHLMVISGLHVALVASWVLWLCRGLARLLQPRRWRMCDWPWLVAGLAAFAYAMLSGPGPPALRAAIMTLIGLWVASGRHAPGVWQGFWLALLLVVLVMPASPATPGLWLSFGSVAILILSWRWRARRHWLITLLRTQWLLTLFSSAAALAAFDRLSLIALPVNLLAIPWVTMVMVPLGLLGWLAAPIAPLGHWLWSAFGICAALFEQAVTGLAKYSPSWQPPGWLTLPVVVLLALMTLIWLLPGLGRRWRWCVSAMLILGACGLSAPIADEQHWTLVVHDIGQGLLVEIRTAHSRWLYDTGPRFPSGFAPIATLWQDGQRFDGVIVSHGDNDHSGGVATLLAKHQVRRWWAPTSHTINAPGVTPCRAGEAWRVDGLTFRLLWPQADATLPDEANNRSCVLLLDDGTHRVLLTGDAETSVERQLLTALPNRPISLLVAGHHGSNSSSAPALLRRLHPQHVVFSAGYLNRYHHPAAAVVRRFRQLGSCLWDTAEDGAVIFEWYRKPGRRDTRVTAVRSKALAGILSHGVEGPCAGVESRR